jgi:hypothetical protein
MCLYRDGEQRPSPILEQFYDLDSRSDDTSSSIQSLIIIIFFQENKCNHIMYANGEIRRYGSGQEQLKKEREEALWVFMFIYEERTERREEKEQHWKPRETKKKGVSYYNHHITLACIWHWESGGVLEF